MYSLFNMANPSPRSASPPPTSDEVRAEMEVIPNAPMRSSKRLGVIILKESFTRKGDFKPKVFRPKPDDSIPGAPKMKKKSKSRISLLQGQQSL